MQRQFGGPKIQLAGTVGLRRPRNRCTVNKGEMLGDMFLVYSAVIDLVSEPGGDSVFWKTTRVVPHKIRPLRKAQGRFAAFVNDAIAEVKPDKVLVARKPENLGARTDP